LAGAPQLIRNTFSKRVSKNIYLRFGNVKISDELLKLSEQEKLADWRDTKTIMKGTLQN